MSLNGGGGGVNCNSNRFFGGSPVYSDVEDSYVGNGVTVNGLKTCWFGIFRNEIGNTPTVSNNTSADPDSTEVASNYIEGNLNCYNNVPAAQLGDSGGSPNIVAGVKTGECASL